MDNLVVSTLKDIAGQFANLADNLETQQAQTNDQISELEGRLMRSEYTLREVAHLILKQLGDY